MKRYLVRGARYPPLPLVQSVLDVERRIVDRRQAYRHSLKIPLRLRPWGSSRPQREGESIDISERGALLQTDLPLRIGSMIDLYLKIPEEITGQPTTAWRCKGRVVRIARFPLLNGQNGHNCRVRVGVYFDSLDVMRSQDPSA